MGVWPLGEALLEDFAEEFADFIISKINTYSGHVLNI